MKRDSCRADAALRESIEQFWREVQAGGGGRDRADPLGVDGLIALFVLVAVEALADVGRQRDVAVPRQALRPANRVRPAPSASGGPRVRPRRVMRRPESVTKAVPEPGWPRVWASISQRPSRSTQEESFPLPAGLLANANEPCGQNLGVVQDNQVAGREQFGQVAKRAVFERTGIAMDDEQRAIRRAGRPGAGRSGVRGGGSRRKA